MNYTFSNLNFISLLDLRDKLSNNYHCRILFREDLRLAPCFDFSFNQAAMNFYFLSKNPSDQDSLIYFKTFNNAYDCLCQKYSNNPSIIQKSKTTIFLNKFQILKNFFVKMYLSQVFSVCTNWKMENAQTYYSFTSGKLSIISNSIKEKNLIIRELAELKIKYPLQLNIETYSDSEQILENQAKHENISQSFTSAETCSLFESIIFTSNLLDQNYLIADKLKQKNFKNKFTLIYPNQEYPESVCITSIGSADIPSKETSSSMINQYIRKYLFKGSCTPPISSDLSFDVNSQGSCSFNKDFLINELDCTTIDKLCLQYSDVSRNKIKSLIEMYGFDAGSFMLSEKKEVLRAADRKSEVLDSEILFHFSMLGCCSIVDLYLNRMNQDFKKKFKRSEPILEFFQSHSLFFKAQRIYLNCKPQLKPELISEQIFKSILILTFNFIKESEIIKTKDIRY